MWTFWSPQTMGLQGQFCGGDMMNQQSQAQTQAQLAALKEQNSILNQQLGVTSSIPSPASPTTSSIPPILIHSTSTSVYTVYTTDADLILVNQDLAGFFTSIDQDRFVRSWFMLLDFLRPKMNVSDDEAFSVYPGKSNNPGDIIKGRTFRRLNVTRKIVIKDVPDLIKSALNRQTFALGQKCVRQSRGSPMGSPLSPALCLMVVSISEQIWSITFHQLLSNHHLFIRHIRYVDNRLIFGDKRLTALATYEVLLDEGFYGKPIILETEPDEEFLGFMLGADLPGTDKHLSSPLAFFSFPSKSPPQWFSLALSHRHQGCLPCFSCPTRSDPINSVVHTCWFSQGGTPDNL